jgi:DNA repair exonuclease SbcCD nuclease subunit
MTGLLVADLHLTDNPRDQYRHDFQKRLRRIVKRHGVSYVLILGDLTEEKDRHGAWLVNQVVEHLARLAKLTEVIILKGNHDYVDASLPYYGFLRRLRGLSFINAPLEAGQGSTALLSSLGRVLLLPHSANPSRDWKGLKLKSYDWVFTHMTFQSAHVGHGRQMKGLPLDTFGDARVVSGDIHIPQKLGEGNVVYVGAPYTVDFGDDYKPRVMLIEDDGTLSSISVDDGPQKRVVEIKSVDELPGAVTLFGNDILKIRYVLQPSEKDSWHNIVAAIRRYCEGAGVNAHVIQPVMAVPGISMKKQALDSKSDVEVLRAYGKLQKLDKAKMKVGLSLLRSA